MEEPASPLSIAFADLSPSERYKILCGAVVPRPIAWVTTINAASIVNAAPFSFFNVFSEDPALIVLGLQHHADGSFKDTTRNIHESGEFVVNLCDESLAQAMNDTAIDFSSSVSEPLVVGLALSASTDISPPRLTSAPFSFECRRQVSMAFGPGRELLVGEVVRVHARPGLLDRQSLHVNYERYAPVGRLSGELYARQSDAFSMPRETVAQFEKRSKQSKSR